MNNNNKVSATTGVTNFSKIPLIVILVNNFCIEYTI